MTAGPIESVTLEDGDVSVSLLTLGCITRDWRVPLGGARIPVVLGRADASGYRPNPGFLGAIEGRVANRIAGARFELGGRAYRLPANDGPNTLHGGPGGIGRRLWRAERDGSRRVRFTLTSADGDQGFPGRVDFAVTVTLAGAALSYEMAAVPDRPTPVSLAQHSYYSLTGGAAEHGDHALQLAATGLTPTGPDLIPTGEIRAFDGGPADFRRPRRLGEADPDRQGIDGNYVLDAARPAAAPAAVLSAPNGLTLRLWTDQPGLQVYTGAHLAPHGTPLAGQSHRPFTGIALEPQGFPDAVNQPAFPSVIVTPERPYRQFTRVEIAGP